MLEAFAHYFLTLQPIVIALVAAEKTGLGPAVGVLDLEGEEVYPWSGSCLRKQS